MKTILAAAIALLMALPAFAQSSNATPDPQDQIARFTWEPPTEREDGTPLDPATELARYDLWCGVPGQDSTADIQIPATGSEPFEVAKSELFPDYGDNYACAMRAVDTDGLESNWSGNTPVPYSKPQSKPNAPRNFIYVSE